MNIIVLQHIKIEDPGYIKDLMLADGLNLTTIELDEGEKIPNDLSKFNGMFCMGGPMDTFMEKDYPWLIEEKKAIKEFGSKVKYVLDGGRCIIGVESTIINLLNKPVILRLGGLDISKIEKVLKKKF